MKKIDRLAIAENPEGGNWVIVCPVCLKLTLSGKYALVAMEDEEIAGMVPEIVICRLCGAIFEDPMLRNERDELMMTFSILSECAEVLWIIPRNDTSSLWEAPIVSLPLTRTSSGIREPSEIKSET